ncbi:MAG: ATP-dependent Clp protease ATP-binding subunit ClpA, partial [Psychromonas sp.]|nr:ATP-dependent Clp protease ATP-binding subunit ClpA [Psychromonas sp.]
MLNKELENSLDLAFHFALEKSHEFMTVEHLLLALLENNEIKTLLTACSVDLVSMHLEIVKFLDSIPSVPEVRSQQIEIQPTIAFERVLQRAIFHVQSSGNTEVSSANVLVAIFSEQESQAVYFLRKANLSRLDVVNYVSHGISKPSESLPDVFYQQENEEMVIEPTEELLFTVNLNEQVENGIIDPLIGRNKEVERCVQILCRRRKNNPLLVGEAGVGKTAIAEGLAYRIVNKD